ncbi:helix-turn-helix transcriptional regulator [Nitrospirillum amazonense]|uniref:helix-turn-helix domain-containing protein n=1 Tax=Nitrospirillum amazonense TaxID=28077 RepID=UPI002DD44115|nr:helix-turn-helix transcriptional regulator [Nitrospirillum amazonense]MEC4591641.1 helix-turn-helix transcriptional regulator [Nitrospirillum amazonense]
MLIDQAIERVRSYRRAQGWSILRLAKEAGMTESTIRHLDRDDWSPNADTLRRLERIVPKGFVGQAAE